MSQIPYSGVEALQQLIAITKANLNTKATQYSTMPTASVGLLGETVQYIGATDTNYAQGDFYKCISDGEVTPTYSWVKITYNKEEVDAAIGAAGHFIVVSELPTTNIQTNVIYLVPKTPSVVTKEGYSDGTSNADMYVSTGSALTPSYDKYEYDTTDAIYIFDSAVTGSDAEEIAGYITAGTYVASYFEAYSKEESRNIKDEYINLDGTTAGWEKIGDTELDLTNYVQFNDLVAITAAEVTNLWANTSPAI